MANVDPPMVEISVYSVRSAIDAWKAGAGRIELCAARGEGGITPSYGMIKQVREQVNLPLFIMIRPRGGDFCYSEAEYEVMKNDILQTRTMGADGIVTGLLTRDGEVDEARMRELVSLSSPLEVTFHRAFDMTRDPERALDSVIRTGATRILTSGLEKDAISGAGQIRKLIEKAGKKITIVPGSGIHSGNIVKLANATGATEFHTSAKYVLPGNMDFKREELSMAGTVNITEYDLVEVDPEEVGKCVRQLRDLRMEGQKPILS